MLNLANTSAVTAEVSAKFNINPIITKSIYTTYQPSTAGQQQQEPMCSLSSQLSWVHPTLVANLPVMMTGKLAGLEQTPGPRLAKLELCLT